MNMNDAKSRRTGQWKAYGAGIIISEATGALSGYLARGGMESYPSAVQQPILSPPPEVFPIVWTILYVLMGIGSARIFLAEPSAVRTKGLFLFGVQLGFNFFWSILFFNLRLFAAAFFWLAAMWILILKMIQAFYQVDRPAAWLQIPYILWVTFAAYLNAGVWILNRM